MSRTCDHYFNKYVNSPQMFGMLQDEFLLTLAGSAIASIGFMYNDITVLLGSMLVSPMGVPIQQAILSLYLGKGTSNFLNALTSLVIMIMLCQVVGFTMSHLNYYYNFYEVPSDTMEKTSSNKFLITNFIIALFVGLFNAYGMVRHKSDLLHGLGLAVALLPPLTNSGLYTALAYNHPEKRDEYLEASKNSFRIALINVVGVALSFYVGVSLFCPK